MSLVALVISVVISKAQILEDISIGTPEAKAVAYFEELTEKDRIRYFTRQDNRQGSLTHELQEGERGYYVVGIPNVRGRWWWPSFGRTFVVIFAISDEGYVTKVEIFDYLAGWP
jgi:hypothetical protein